MHKWLDNNYTRLIEIRHYLHQHPELGYEEYNTSDYLKNLLKQAGYFITQTEQMGTGFFCELGEGHKPVLGIRCDIDALPIQDQKQVEYRSKIDGVMHACGHDVHMTILTGLALLLKEKPIHIPGTIRFIYQPAEEKTPSGSIQMIKAGCIDGLDHLIGYHILPKMDSNKIGIKSGPMSAAVSSLEFTLNGPGGHTSRPEETINLVAVAAKLINEVEHTIQRLNTKDTPVVMGFGQITGGHTFNVIPSIINLRGSVRYLEVEMKRKIQQHIRKSIKSIKEETGAEINFKIPYSIPPVINDKKLTKIIEQGAVHALGKNNVLKMDKSSMGSDDFGFYIDKLPCSLFRIGSSNGQVMDLHVSDFDVDENCIRTAIKVLHHTIIEYFKDQI
jgi:amidohydrolase